MSIQSRALATILEEHAGASINDLALPAFAKKTIASLIGVEIASDFIVCDVEYHRKYNELLHSECPGSEKKWIVFAVSGQGDFWLLDCEKNSVGYYDHNTEDLNISNVQSMSISLEEWVVLADIVSQLESKPGSVCDREDFESAISSLGLRLSNLPFEYF